MKAKLLFLSIWSILLMAPLTQSFGQASGGIGFYTPGIHTLPYADLNKFLPSGYPVIADKPFVTGGAGYGVISNILIGGETGTMHAGSFTRDNQQIDLSGSYGFFSLGYLVYNKKGLVVYPLVSIGDNVLEVYIHQRDQSTSFGTVTGEPSQATTLVYKTKMLKFSLSGLYTVGGARTEKGNGGFMVGLEAGYQMAYKTSDWTYDNGTINNGPDFNANGFFIQLLIGGGGVFRK